MRFKGFATSAFDAINFVMLRVSLFSSSSSSTESIDHSTSQLMKEKEMAMQDSNDAISGGRYGGNRPRGAKPGTSVQRKQAAAERIGATGSNRR